MEPIVVQPDPIVAKPEPIVIEPRIEPPPVIVSTAEPEPIVAPEPFVAEAPAEPAPKTGMAARMMSAAARLTQAIKPHKTPKPPKPETPIVLRPLKRLPPLAMWARIDLTVADQAPIAPQARHEDNEVAALMESLRVPPHVLSVSYPHRPHIRRVRTEA